MTGTADGITVKDGACSVELKYSVLLRVEARNDCNVKMFLKCDFFAAARLLHPPRKPHIFLVISEALKQSRNKSGSILKRAPL